MRHQIPDGNLPAVLGHENAGMVVALGEGVDEFFIGERVAAEPLHACLSQGRSIPCPACQAGQYHLCSQLGHVGIPARLRLPGGFGPYSLYHKSTLFHLPDNVSFEEAAILDVMACGVHALRLGQPTPGQTVVVLGCGVIGLSMIQCLRVAGVTDIVAVSSYSFQAEAARQLGAKEVVCVDQNTNPADQVLHISSDVDQAYECVGGNKDTLQQGIDICRPGGKVVSLGFFSGIRPINLNTLFLKEVSIQPSDGYSTWGMRREFDMALQLLSKRQVLHTPLITHCYPRSEAIDAIDVAFHKSSNRSIKVVLTSNPTA
jgi:(R,R)-butanediol dehydrogenase/meso-butanediol dehydrogenase/diacetyl reductase